MKPKKQRLNKTDLLIKRIWFLFAKCKLLLVNSIIVNLITGMGFVHPVYADEYIVKKGDILSDILYSRDIKPLYGKKGNLAKIIKLNKFLKRNKGDILYPGMKLNLDFEISTSSGPARLPQVSSGISEPAPASAGGAEAVVTLPEPTPIPVPSPSLSLAPSPLPTASPTPSAESSPTPSSEPSPSPEPAPAPEPSPSLVPSPSPEPSSAPAPASTVESLSPTPTPTPTAAVLLPVVRSSRSDLTLSFVDQFLRLKSSDFVSGAEATLLSTASRGLQFSWGHNWSENLRSSLTMQTLTVTLQEPSSSTKTLTNKTNAVALFQCGVDYKQSENLFWISSLAVNENLVSRSTNSSTIAIEKFVVPFFVEGMEYKLFQVDNLAIKAIGHLHFVLPASQENYDSKFSFGRKIGFGVIDSIGSYNIKGEAFYQRLNLNMSNVGFDQTNIGVTIGIEKRLGGLD